jgi:sterol desaturase/sphingolipid hydroxylase (fatty acid hydroxylase superfamily)
MIEYFSTHIHAFLVDAFRIGLWLAIVSAIFMPLEHLFGLRRQKIWRKEFGNDLCYYAMNMVVPSVLMGPPLALVGMIAHRVVPHDFYATVAGMPFWARGLVGFVVGDIGYYWAHRCLHTVPFLWRFHAIHHSAQEVDFLVNTRLHPLDMAFGRLGGIIPLYALGLTGPIGPSDSIVPALVIMVGSTWGYFLHANLRWRYGMFAQIIGTPAFHRWHHTIAPANRNYASMLPWLDRIFGTYYVPKGEWPASYGIDHAMPDSLVEQLAYPFVGHRPPTASAALPER